MFKNVLYILLIFTFFGCKTTRISKKASRKIETSFFKSQFTGVLVYNPTTNDTIVSHNANKYFTPASNTKIFTLFTALKTLGSSIPLFKYQINKDSITLIGTGNPTFLHSYFKDSTALQFAKKYKKATVVLQNFSDTAFGAGWAWEDYDTYFSAQRSAFPMYGNVLTISKKDSLVVVPKILKDKVRFKKSKFRRSQNKNEFFYAPNRTKETEIPLLMSVILQQKLWKNLLPNVTFSNKPTNEDIQIAYGIKSDSVYKRMMYQSDNFLAEQLLIMASSTLSDTLSSKKIRKYVLENDLQFLKHKPRWVDGSGLSRYNLFTPTSLVQVLNELYKDIPSERLFSLFPAGGKSGTLKKWYKGEKKPYIYAKSGTLSNNYSLSGYLITNSGKTLIFSFMNNHYRKPTSEIKEQMQVFFEYLRDHY